MANVQHSALTGASLHESKGADTAATGTVQVANGSGSATWTTVGLSSMSSTAKSFQAQLLQVQDKRSTSSAGDTVTSGAYQTRALNTVITNEISASLASNQITLPAGTYFALIYCVIGAVSHYKNILKNITDGTTTLLGQTGHCNTGMDSGVITGRFTIAGSKVFEVQTRAEVSAAPSPSTFDNEIYTDVLIWKVG